MAGCGRFAGNLSDERKARTRTLLAGADVRRDRERPGGPAFFLGKKKRHAPTSAVSPDARARITLSAAHK